MRWNTFVSPVYTEGIELTVQNIYVQKVKPSVSPHKTMLVHNTRCKKYRSRSSWACKKRRTATSRRFLRNVDASRVENGSREKRSTITGLRSRCIPSR